MDIEYREARDFSCDAVLQLYRAHAWSSAKKPHELYRALLNSHRVITAWDGLKLVGLANSISDGALVVYYPHAVVLPDYQGRGVGLGMMQCLMKYYEGFHQQVLIADGRAVDFYKKCGFTRAGKTEPMWIFEGKEH